MNALQELFLSDIRIDGGTQPRTEIDWELVHEYSECVSNLPPAIVYFDGVSYWLADGFHRYHAHSKAGKQAIMCDVVKGTVRDAILYSVGANSEHGARRTNEDKRKAVLTLLNDKEWVEWSDVKVAEQCKVHRSFVGKIRRENPSHATVASEKTYTTKHGTVSTMHTENIGKKKPATSYTAPLEEQGEEDPVDDIQINTEPQINRNFALAAKYQLERIDPLYDKAKEAFEIVTEYINSRMKELKLS